jgi:hypothetical protein
MIRAKLPKNPGKPEFLNKLVFDWDAPYPKSQELGNFLTALHFTASVSAQNPRFDTILIDSAAQNRWMRNLEQGEPNLKSFIESAAELAQKEFAAVEQD